MSNDSIRVLVVDDHDVVREGLAGFLRVTPDIELVGEAVSGEQAVSLCLSLQPDVVLMDVQMPGEMDGIAATRAIIQANCTSRVLILSSFGDDRRVHQAMQAGATGYLLKNASIHQMTEAIRAAANGRTTLSPEVTQALIHAHSRPQPTYQLKPREKEVLTLLIAGMTNDQIARELDLSLSTIKFHVSSILAKLAVESRTEAVALAVRERLVESE